MGARIRRWATSASRTNGTPIRTTAAVPITEIAWKGLASGPAIEKRWGIRGEDLPSGHPAWELEAHYLALAVANWSCMFSPQRIILGGGVMQRLELLPRIQMKTVELLNGYLDMPEIVPPELGRRAGVLGAIALAQARSI